MIDMTMTYLMSFCIAMILVALAATAYEFRRMSSLRSQRNPSSLQTAREFQTWRTR
jgi:hypothetical protein